MSWNYRIVDWGDNRFDVREVYYAPNGKVTACMANPCELVGGSAAEILDDLKMMLADAKRLPVLDYRDLPGATSRECKEEG